MSRYIDADKMIADLLTVDPQYETMIWWCCDVTNAQPTADVVEVVRCKDCKYGEENCKSPIYGMWCKRFGAEKSNLAVLPTDFCSYGKRKDNE